MLFTKCYRNNTIVSINVAMGEGVGFKFQRRGVNQQFLTFRVSEILCFYLVTDDKIVLNFGSE